MFFTFTGNDASCAGRRRARHRRARGPRRAAAAMGDASPAPGGRVAEHPAVVDVRGRGMFWGIELRASGGAFAAGVVRVMAGPVGVPGRVRRPVPDAVMVAPPLSSPRPSATSSSPASPPRSTPPPHPRPPGRRYGRRQAADHLPARPHRRRAGRLDDRAGPWHAAARRACSGSSACSDGSPSR